jgi:hypothetical protein
LTNSAGCDSSATVILTINHSTSSSVSQTAIDSYIWPLNATTYTSSGAYTAITANQDGCSHTTTLNLTIINTVSRSAGAIAGWNLVSVPVQQADMSPAGIFGDDYGETPYYVFQYGSTGGYTASSLLRPGQGYWLGANTGQAVDAVGIPLSGASLALTSGFNIIGDPFPEAEPVGNLRFTNGTNTLTMDEAAGSPYRWLSNVIYKYTGDGYNYETAALEVWKGYWIPILVDGITIQYAPAPGGPIAKAVAAPSREQMTSSLWSVDLAAKLVTPDGKTAIDGIASFGVRDDATSAFDSRYDAPRPPRGPNGDYVEVGFIVSGESYPKIYGSAYARDIRAAEKPSWEFVVNTSGNGTVTLNWDKNALSGLGNDVRLEMYDEAAHKMVDMKAVDNYTYEQAEPGRRFTVNKPGYDLPTSFQLAQNYPNPFNPQTTITYGLPTDAEVSLEVYNILGAKVITLVDRQMVDAGYHEVKFEASSLPSGLYFYRLNATGEKGARFTEARKMVLVK